jgi:hypothetical protein
VPGAAALEEIEQAFASRRAPVQIELAHLADPAIGALLTGRGYQLTSFENVLGLALTAALGRVTPRGVEVRPSGDDEFETWTEVVADGVAHPDEQGVPSHEEFPRGHRKGRTRSRRSRRDTLHRAARRGHRRRRQLPRTVT